MRRLILPVVVVIAVVLGVLVMRPTAAPPPPPLPVTPPAHHPAPAPEAADGSDAVPPAPQSATRLASASPAASAPTATSSAAPTPSAPASAGESGPGAPKLIDPIGIEKKHVEKQVAQQKAAQTRNRMYKRLGDFAQSAGVSDAQLDKIKPILEAELVELADAESGGGGDPVLIRRETDSNAMALLNDSQRAAWSRMRAIADTP